MRCQVLTSTYELAVHYCLSLTIVDTVEQGFHEGYRYLELQQCEVDGAAAHGLIMPTDDPRQTTTEETGVPCMGGVSDCTVRCAPSEWVGGVGGRGRASALIAFFLAPGGFVCTRSALFERHRW